MALISGGTFAVGQTIDVSASSRGFVADFPDLGATGVFGQSAGSAYRAGSFPGVRVSRNFFAFELGAVSDDNWITGATFAMDTGPASFSATGDVDTLTFRQLNGLETYVGQSQNLFNDIGTGPSFASITHQANVDTTLSVDFASQLANLNALNLSDGTFTFGGSFDDGGEERFGDTTAGVTELQLTTTANTAAAAAGVAVDDSLSLIDGSAVFSGTIGDSDITNFGDFVSYQWKVNGIDVAGFGGTVNTDGGAVADLTFDFSDLTDFGITTAGDYDVDLEISDRWGQGTNFGGTVSVAAVPEPGSASLALIGLTVLGLARRRRK